MAVVMAVSLFTCIWGLALMYDKGYQTGYAYAEQVMSRA